MDHPRNPFNGRSLYRYFDTEAHADALTQGEVWISTLTRCRQYENQHQGDPGEGLLYYSATVTDSDKDFVEIARRSGVEVGPHALRVRVADNIVAATPFAEDAFVLCTSLRFDPNSFKAAWNAEFCTEISNAAEFLRLVSECLGGIFGAARVRGELGDVMYPQHGTSDPIGFVKRFKYRGQEEVRMLWTVPGPEPYKPFQLHAPEVAPLCHRRISAPSKTAA